MRLEKISEYFMEVESIEERKRTSKERLKFMQRQKNQRNRQGPQGRHTRFESKAKIDRGKWYGKPSWYHSKDVRGSPERFYDMHKMNWQQAEYYRQRHGERRPERPSLP